MIFPMWPEYYKTRAREALESKKEITAYFCAGAVCILLAVFLEWFVCIVMGPCLIILAIGACCFNDLRLGQNDCCSAEALFFHPGCIAFAYDEAAWQHLQLQID